MKNYLQLNNKQIPDNLDADSNNSKQFSFVHHKDKSNQKHKQKNYKHNNRLSLILRKQKQNNQLQQTSSTEMLKNPIDNKQKTDTVTIKPPLTQVQQSQQQQTILQSAQGQNQRIKQRGFSLQYLRIAKKQKVRSLFQIKYLKKPNNLNQRLRVKTQDQLSIKTPLQQQFTFKNNSFQRMDVGNNKTKIFFSRPHNQNRHIYTNSIDNDNNYNGRSESSIDINSLNNFDRLSLIKMNKKRQSQRERHKIFSQNGEQRNTRNITQINVNKESKARNDFSTNAKRSFKTQYYDQLINTPVTFIHLSSAKSKPSDFYFSAKPNISPRKQQNSSFHRTSKYSPFKSKYASSAGKYDDCNSNLNESHTNKFYKTKQQLRDMHDEGIKTLTKFSKKENKKIKFLNNKRFNSIVPSSTKSGITKLERINQKIADELNQVDQSPQSPSKSPKKSFTFNYNFVQNQFSYQILTQGLLNHIKLIKQMKKCFQLQNPSSKKLSRKLQQRISQLIKVYVLGTDKQKKNIQNEDKNSFGNKNKKKQKGIQFNDILFSKVDYIFQQAQDKNTIKKIVCCQKLLIILIVDLLSKQRLRNLVEQIKITFKMFLNIYVAVVNSACSNIQYLKNHKDQLFSQILSQQQLQQYQNYYSAQKSLRKYIIPYTENLFRYNKQFYQKQLKPEIQQSKTKTINRTFYQILKKFAILLTNSQQSIMKNTHNQIIINFITCPAPYILPKSTKRYTLCVDLDSTLLYSKFGFSNKFQTYYRPGAKQFIIQMSKYFQIVVFTSALKQYADQVAKPFCQFIDHMLYRYHTTRGMHSATMTKDLTRIGRKLQKVILIDDLECNTMLQPSNSIQITPWTGQMNDKELFHLKNQLIKIGRQQQQIADIRIAVTQMKKRLIVLNKSM